jgi:hypothetical protein
LGHQINDGVPVVLGNEGCVLRIHASILCQFAWFVNSFC